MTVQPARWDDLDHVATLGSPAAPSAGRRDRLRAEWLSAGFVVGADNWVAREDGRLVGYAAVFLSGRLVLAAQTAAVADELLDAAVRRGRALGLETLQFELIDADPVLVGLAERKAFVRGRETLRMSCRTSGVVRSAGTPEGIALRSFERADATAVHALLDEAYAGWDANYRPVARARWVAAMTGDSEFDPALWWLAEREGNLAGCALYWSSGWLKDLAVRSTERGRGLGAALVRRGLSEFADRGIARVGLKVDASNPTGAVRLYARLGFATERSEVSWTLRL